MNGNLERLLSTKQEELRAITVWKVVELEKKYIAKEKECREKDVKIKGLKATFDSMRSDFAYNLELLRERDLELERYDKFVKQYRETINSKDYDNVKKKQIIKELRLKVGELEEDAVKNNVKVSELTHELAKLSEEKKAESKQALTVSESIKQQFEVKLDAARCSTVAAQDAARNEAQKLSNEIKILQIKLGKSESTKNQVEKELKSFQKDSESRIVVLKARVKALEKSMDKLRILKERLESENMDKSHVILEQRKRVEDIQEEIMSSYKSKMQKLSNELTLVRDQNDEQRKVFEGQLAAADKKLVD